MVHTNKDSNGSDGKVLPKCDHNAEQYYSSIFDENGRETRVKRCGKCHQVVNKNVIKSDITRIKSHNVSSKR